MEMKQVNGFWFPDSDSKCSRVIFEECESADLAVGFCKSTNVCIQAGGNVGVWAAHLAKTFEEVWTFEPDFENYICLTRNVPTNVFRFMAGLGHKNMTVDLDRVDDNCGAHQVNLNGGTIPLMTIDDLGLKACDLIILDIEGMEPLAIEGARKTIAEFMPVLMIEDRDISRRYGHRQGWPEKEIPGYRVAAKTRRDVILIPE